MSKIMIRGQRYLTRLLLKLLKVMNKKTYYPVNGANRTCNICGFEGAFSPFGLYYVRPDAICSNCGSGDRHRLLRLWFDSKQACFSSARVLHFAPEPCVTRFVKNAVGEYVTADLLRNDVDHNWNIENIDADDESFDLIICSHVLEHVDATKALHEFKRCLRKNGIAAVMIPICEGLDRTYENLDMAHGDNFDRWVHFQQSDHVRIFGRDFRNLVSDADFDLVEFTAEGPVVPKLGLNMGEKVFELRLNPRYTTLLR